MGIIARITEQPGENVAVRVGATAISYARLLSDVDSAAVLFRDAGVGEGATVGIRAGPAENGHSYANWVAHLAIMKLGAGHVSMTDAGAIKASLQAAKVHFVIGHFEALVDVPLSVPRIQFHLDPGTPAPAGKPVADNEAAARRLNLTSGTTGKPKLLAWDAAMMEKRVDQVRGDSLVNAATRLHPLLHLRTTAGFRYPLAVWVSGGCVILPQAEKGLQREREALPLSNLIICSPPQLKERLTAIQGEWPGKEERTIVLLGGRLPTRLRDEALGRACSRLLISYGATETGSIASGDHAVVDRHPGAVGFLRQGAEVEIVGPKGERVPAGEPGLVRVRSALTVSSYEPGPRAANGGHFRDGWFYSGDIGRLFEDGLLAIEGRAGDVLNLGGWKVSAVDLESRVADIPGVKDACAVAMQLPEGDMLTFAIVCDDGFDVSGFRRQVDAMLKRRRPFQVIRMPSIPRNAMGKIPRPMIASQLAAIYGAGQKNAAHA